LLIQIIANTGIGGGCSVVCGELPESWMQQVCFILCEIEGIEYFSELLQDVDPDPIWICMELDACPSVKNATGVIKKMLVTPTAAPQMSTFSISFTYQITSETGAGQTLIAVVPPSESIGEIFGWENLIVSQEPGMYQVSAEFVAEPSQEPPEDFIPGVYEVFCEVCEGTCGDTHSTAYLIASGVTSFNITQ